MLHHYLFKIYSFLWSKKSRLPLPNTKLIICTGYKYKKFGHLQDLPGASPILCLVPWNVRHYWTIDYFLTSIRLIYVYISRQTDSSQGNKTFLLRCWPWYPPWGSAGASFYFTGEGSLNTQIFESSCLQKSTFALATHCFRTKCELFFVRKTTPRLIEHVTFRNFQLWALECVAVPDTL